MGSETEVLLVEAGQVFVDLTSKNTLVSERVESLMEASETSE